MKRRIFLKMAAAAVVAAPVTALAARQNPIVMTPKADIKRMTVDPAIGGRSAGALWNLESGYFMSNDASAAFIDAMRSARGMHHA